MWLQLELKELEEGSLVEPMLLLMWFQLELKELEEGSLVEPMPFDVLECVVQQCPALLKKGAYNVGSSFN